MKYMFYSLARPLLLVITPNNGLAVITVSGEHQQRKKCHMGKVTLQTISIKPTLLSFV